MTDDEITEDKIDWRPFVDDGYKEVVDDFYNPLVPEEVILEEKLHGANTAHFDFKTNKTHMSTKFLDNMHKHGEISPEDLVRGLCKHELGHYLIYPKECSTIMFLKHFSQGQFDEFTNDVLAYWFDVMDNLPQMLKELRGKEVRELYRSMNTLIQKEMILSDRDKERLSAMQLDPDEISRVYRKYSVDRLMIGYYQKQGGEDLGSDIDFDYVERRQEYNEKRKKDKDIQEWVSDEEKFLEEKMVEMLTLDFTNPENELVNFVQYGTIIAEVLKNLKNELPEVWMVLSSGCDCEGECDGSCGSGKGGEDEDDGEGMGSILRKLIRGVLVDAPDLKDFSDEQIEDGLDKIIREWGKQRYEKIREFVEKELGKKFDQPPEERKQQKGIGLSSSSLQLYDEQIPYYKRLSRTYGLYIHRKPMIVDVTESFPQGSEKFRVGDKVRRMNPFSTGGRIYPGLTKKYKEKSGTKKDRQYKIPDLFIWLDSSGSMEHPNSGSKAITASFVLARNYWENGAKVGVANFSCDTAFLFPTRDLDLAYSMLCAYWGGGTVLNVDKIKEYVEKMAKGGPAGMPQMPYYTTEQDYEHLVARMPEQQQKEFLDKKMEVDVSKKVQDTYEKMDNVLITDGGIWNLEEVIGYLNGLAELTRNTVFLIDSWGQGEEWSQKSLPYTQIITVSKPEDLLGLSIGEAKKIVPDQEKPASLFYQ